MKPTVRDMHQHVARICEEHDIFCFYEISRTVKAYSVREFDEIHIAPIRSALSYATALHKIGHILGRHQNSQKTLVRERWAWFWARRHALVWTPERERSAQQALAWYERREEGGCKTSRHVGRQPARGSDFAKTGIFLPMEPVLTWMYLV